MKVLNDRDLLGSLPVVNVKGTGYVQTLRTHESYMKLMEPLLKDHKLLPNSRYSMSGEIGDIQLSGAVDYIVDKGDGTAAMGFLTARGVTKLSSRNVWKLMLSRAIYNQENEIKIDKIGFLNVFTCKYVEVSPRDGSIIKSFEPLYEIGVESNKYKMINDVTGAITKDIPNKEQVKLINKLNNQ